MKRPLVLGQVLANLAMAFKEKGNDSLALKLSLEASNYAAVCGDKRTVGCCDETISSAYRDLGNIVEAIKYGERAFENFNNSGEVHYATTVLGNLALCQERLGRIENALSFHLKAYEKSRIVNNIAGSQIRLGNIVRLARDLGRLDILAKYHADAGNRLPSPPTYGPRPRSKRFCGLESRHQFFSLLFLH
jgi:tetratricopeptide (TPR) repeat protein